jgi:hypothetical protein
MHLKTPAILLLFSVFILSCGNRNDKKLDVNISDIELSIKIKRFDKAVFKINQNDLKNELLKLSSEYPFFIGKQIDDSALAKFRGYFSDPTIILNHSEVEKQFANITSLESQLTSAFKHYKYYFPEKKVPSVYSYISGTMFDKPIIYDDTVVAIGLDMYLGSEYPLYNSVGLPAYFRHHMQKDYISRDIMEEMSYQYISGEIENMTLLSQLINFGKVQYFIDAMLPEVQDSVKMRYTGKQAEWCKANEKNIWSFFIDKKLLYITDQHQINKFFIDAPFSSSFGNDSAPYIGKWIGWQIIRSFMKENHDISLKQMLLENDPQKILKLSKYKPSK